MTEIYIFIFRRDFRIHDNLALNRLIAAASSSGVSGNKGIYPMFIFNPKQIYAKNNEYFSNNCVQFMIESLDELDKHIHINYFEATATASTAATGDTDILTKLSKKYKIKAIAYNKDYSPFAIKRDKAIEDWASTRNITIITAEDYTLYPMGTILNNKDDPYQVFTPFYKKSLTIKVPAPEPLAVAALAAAALSK